MLPNFDCRNYWALNGYVSEKSFLAFCGSWFTAIKHLILGFKFFFFAIKPFLSSRLAYFVIYFTDKRKILEYMELCTKEKMQKDE